MRLVIFDPAVLEENFLKKYSIFGLGVLEENIFKNPKLFLSWKGKYIIFNNKNKSLNNYP